LFVKTFELKRRLETRLLVRDADGGVYGVVYKWRDDNSDADLLNSSLTEQIDARQSWYYPSRHDCLQCHNAGAGGVLGVKTRQINRSLTYSSGVTDNQIRTWNHLGLFQPAINVSELAMLPALAAMDDTGRSIEDRARSYLDANCAQCHRPAGTVAYFDARYDTPLAQQQLIDGAVLIDQGIDRPRIISPHDIWRSIAYMRMNTDTDIRMPPLARETIDQHGVALLGQWISSLPGRDVVAPPVISPSGGTFDHPLQVTLRDTDPGADIRYTLDGSVPAASDAHYDQPIAISASTVLRARAFKPGLTRSITAQEAFIVDVQ
jgi:mono/diheme cytochrome c family protein